MGRHSLHKTDLQKAA